MINNKVHLLVIIFVLICGQVHSQSPLDSLDIYDPFTHVDNIRRIIKTRLSILSGENKTLIKKYEHQVEEARKTNSREAEAVALQNAAYIFFKSALYNIALDYYQRALEIYEESRDYTKAALVKIEIGRTYYFADLESHTKEYMVDAYRKLVKTNDEEQIAYANYALGIVTDNPERKSNHFKKALELQRRVIKRNSSDVKSKERYARYLNANGFTEEALKIAEEIDDKWLIVLYLNNIGQIKYTEGRFNEAIEIYKRSLKISKAAKLMGLIRNTYVNLAVIYRMMGDWQKSARNREIAGFINERLYVEENAIQLSEIRVKYEIIQKEMENEFLRKEKEIIQEKMSDEVKLNYLLIITICGISFTSVLAIFSRRKIKRANELLAKQKNEIKEKNEVLENLNEELKNSGEKLNNALETAQLANWEWDPAKDKLYYSNEFPKIYMVSETELFENPRKAIINKIHNDYKGAFEKYFYGDLTEMQILESEYKIVNGHTEKWVRAKRIPVRDENNNVVRVFGTVQDITQSKKAEEAKIQLVVQQSFTEKLLTSQEEERKRIAGELHDSLGQEILLIKNRAQLGLQGEFLDQFTTEQLNKINDASSELLNIVRDIAFNLRPAHLERLGLTETIVSLIKKLNESTQINITHSIDNIDNLLSVDEEINLYRIIQECLSNIVKHSQATNAQIIIKKNEHQITLEISDDGKGIDTKEREKITGFGLVNIQNRVNLLKGEMLVTSEINKGLKLSILLSLQKI